MKKRKKSMVYIQKVGKAERKNGLIVTNAQKSRKKKRRFRAFIRVRNFFNRNFKNWLIPGLTWAIV